MWMFIAALFITVPSWTQPKGGIPVLWNTTHKGTKY